MRPISLSTTLIALAVAAAVAGCGTTATTVSEPPTAGGGAAGTPHCPTAIPDSVIAAFGWEVGPAATPTGGGCQRDAAHTAGSVWVDAVPLPDSSAAGAQRTFDTSCNDISGTAGPDESFEPTVSWLSGAKGCAHLRATTDGRGMLQLYALVDGKVLDLTVSLISPSTPQSRQAGASAAVAAAAPAL